MPSGRKCAKDAESWFRSPTSTVASHNGIAKPKFSGSWVVGVNVYGSKPIRFILSRKTITVTIKSAHLWAGLFVGIRMCLAKVPKNSD